MKTRYLIQILTLGPADSNDAISFLHAYQLDGEREQPTLVYTDLKLSGENQNLVAHAVDHIAGLAGSVFDETDYRISAIQYREGDRALAMDHVGTMALDHIRESLEQRHGCALGRELGKVNSPIIDEYITFQTFTIHAIAKSLAPIAARDFLAMVFASHFVKNSDREAASI